MNKRIKFLLLSSLLVLATGCGQSLAQKTITLQGQEFIVEIADTAVTQKQGLSGRKTLAENAGMLFIFEDKKIQSFWMKEMNFPLDIIWLADDEVIGWESNVPVPQDKNNPLISYQSPQPANQVLELIAGSVEKLDLKIGDSIIIQ
jgi:hypothetical protein